MGEHEGAYRRRRPEGTVLYEAVRDNLATSLAEASEVGRGLPRYMERDFTRPPAALARPAPTRCGPHRNPDLHATTTLTLTGALAVERTTHMLVGSYDSAPCTLRLHASTGVRNNSCLKAFFGIAGK